VGFNKLHKWESGQSITAPMLNQLRDTIARTIIGGAGVQVTQLGNQVLITLDPYGNRGGGGGSSGTISTDSPENTSDTAAAGTSTEVSASDHVHPTIVTTGEPTVAGTFGDVSTSLKYKNLAGTVINITHFV
jgi:hypothetical protein